jgi:hypothetical protein
MSAGASLAFALLRVPRGVERPTEQRFRQALDEDRHRLSLPSANGVSELEIAGPYAIIVDGTDLDEWVAWER